MLRKLDLIGVQSDWGASQRGASMGPASPSGLEGLWRVWSGGATTYGTGEILAPGRAPGKAAAL